MRTRMYYKWQDFIFCLKKIFVYPFQRFFRGYSDVDLWNLDAFYSEIIVKSMKAFKEKTIAYPPVISFEKWQEILDDIIFAFEHEGTDWYDLELKEKNLTEAEKAEIAKRVDRGFEYFKEYYRALWW